MEELHSTEVLDREILEDARKKAHKLLKNAEDTIGREDAAWEKKAQEAVSALREVCQGRLDKVREEIMARLPLDKRRSRSETTEGLLRGALDEFLRGLSREDLLWILVEKLGQRLARAPEFRGEETLAYYENMEEAEVERVLREALAISDPEPLSQNEISELLKLMDEDSPAQDPDSPANPAPGGSVEKSGAKIYKFPGGDRRAWGAVSLPALKLERDEGRIVVSIEGEGEVLLEENRAELAAALLGGEALND